MSDLVLDHTCQEGDQGGQVGLIQEWLCLHNFGVVIDGDFGPATDSALRQFQGQFGLPVDGIVAQPTFAALIQPMTAALSPIRANGRTLGPMIVAYAQQHLAQHPLEVGGNNCGPWVRLYMDGQQGADDPWCAGFACFIMGQAAQTLGVTTPITSSFSCSVLADSAKQAGLFLDGDTPADLAKVGPGCFFLERGGPTGWQHTGITVQTMPDSYQTIEGNTNDNGSADGYEVCARTRNYTGKDFVLIS
jgi:hypothetical protein